MEFKVNLSDYELQTIANDYTKRLKEGSVGGFSLQKLVQDKVDTELKKADYSKLLSSILVEAIESQIASAIHAKVPGWIKQQVKEMLRYAKLSWLDRADNKSTDWVGWNPLFDPPTEEGKYLLLMSNGIIISGWYTHSKFIPDNINTEISVISWAKSGLVKES